MKAKDLKEGNLIISCGHVVKCTISDLMEMKSSEIINETTDRKPIPLNEEQLNKLGASYFKENMWNIGKFLIAQKEDGSFYMGYGDDNEWQILPIQLSSVHDLQNAYSLTGEDLKIDILKF